MAREKTDLFKGWPNAEKPAFHEIQALGVRLYEETSINPRGLLGHLEEKTTRIYLDRHEGRWAEIRK